ncbi:FkbM family methyltransferase [Candidatus Magnetomonas plexicatena]|uniref:FkbM family methyltransferase n=1 Tax=Candidatus Magnetomonas plexicatena TaxID=2552947 RepID=UPI001C75D71E|nr:FkbM family methyltransferase [Nitrospirales bacterium LBB_01]
MINKIMSLFPSLKPKVQEQGYKPPLAIRALRAALETIVNTLGLNCNNELMVELLKILDPSITVKLPGGQSIIFTTGHTRLLWRARTLLTEETSTIEWIDTFDSADVFYDIGANVGSYTLYAAKTKGVRVFAFEPEINNFQLLYSNIYKNELFDLCVPLSIACHDSTAMQTFYVRDFSKGDATHSVGRVAKYVQSAPRMFEVETLCMKLDDIIETFKLPPPTKIKIDVDTNELYVIRGLIKTLPVIKEICVELDMDFDEHRELVKILQDAGFEIIREHQIYQRRGITLHNVFFRKTLQKT